MPPPSEKRGRAIYWLPLMVLAILLGFALGAVAVHLYHTHVRPLGSFEGGEATAKPALDKVVALGRIEPRDGILSLGVPVPDRIRKIDAREGISVKKGERLVLLDSEVMRKLEQQLAVIQSDQAKERLQAITESGNAQVRVEEVRRERITELEPLEIKSLRSKIKYLEAQEKNAQQNYERYVAAGDTIAKQDREKQELVSQQVQSELIATKSQLEQLEKSSTLNRRVANAQLEAARASLKQSQSAISLKLLATQLEQAKERLKESQVLAPSDGKVLHILAHEGELVHGQPILQMANIENMIVLTEVYETDIQRVRVGQTARITSHIFPEEDALTGKVVWKAATVGKARVIDLDPRAAVDNRVVDVKVELDQPQRVADLIGHQVRVEIQTELADKRR
jgi:HlyD family secretion protein